jgi:hypothetical protein
MIVVNKTNDLKMFFKKKYAKNWQLISLTAKREAVVTGECSLLLALCGANKFL